MKIYDFVKCSFVDYPGKIAAVIFTRGCNFNCSEWCHNKHIIPYDGPVNTTEEKVLAYLRKRATVLQGVVVTGGEPTVQPDLLEFLAKLRALCTYSIKLDTNGYRPDILKQILERKLVDYIAMDIKAPKEKYEKLTKVPYKDNKIQASIDLIKNSGLPHQFRTTVFKKYLNDADIQKIRAWIQDDANYITQECILRDANGEPIER